MTPDRANTRSAGQCRPGTTSSSIPFSRMQLAPPPSARNPQALRALRISACVLAAVSLSSRAVSLQPETDPESTLHNPAPTLTPSTPISQRAVEPEAWTGPTEPILDLGSAVPMNVGSGGLTINIAFGTGLTDSQKSLFTTAKETWQSLLGNYNAAVLAAGNVIQPTITASGEAIDGVGGTLGSAGPNLITKRAGIWLSKEGQMSFDTADLASMEANGSLYSVILHEMAHVLGFGTLWTYNSLYVNGSGQYTGAKALAAYKTEFNQPGATFVPVELGGSSGTANGHWNEVDNGSGLTGITQIGTGKDMRNELMTGWLNTPTFISKTTLAAFADLGFDPVPEPAEYATAFGLLLATFTVIRRRAAAQSR